MPDIYINLSFIHDVTDYDSDNLTEVWTARLAIDGADEGEDKLVSMFTTN